MSYRGDIELQTFKGGTLLLTSNTDTLRGDEAMRAPP